MTGFTTVDSVINAVSANNKMQRLTFNKLLPSTTAAAKAHTFWLATGIPGAGANPTGGTAGAAVCGSTTAGAMLYGSTSAAGNTMHLVSFGGTASAAGVLYLVDRLAHAQLTNNQANGSFSPVLIGSARLNTNEGAQLITEVTAQLSAAANTLTYTYLNESNTAGRITPTVTTISAAVVGRTTYDNFMFVPLQAGDRGVRAVTNWTLASGTATGSYNLVMVKPIAQIPITSAQLWSDRDFVVELPNLPKLQADSCLMFYFMPATAATSWILGEVRIAEN